MIKYTSLLFNLIICSIITNASVGQIPTFVKPANVGDVQVYSIEIVFHTTNIKDAGTDDKIKIRFNDNMKYFNLNKSNDEFERNQQDRFILSDRTIKFIKDIKYISLLKDGTDGWSFDYLAIRINDATMYEAKFNSAWLDNVKGYKNSYLIGGAYVQSIFGLFYNKPCSVHATLPNILKYQLKNMIETAVGDAIDSNYYAAYVISHGVAWGNTTGINTLFGDATEFKVQNPHTLSVDLDLQNIYSNWPNSEYDVDFDIFISCTNGNVKAEIISKDLNPGNVYFNVPKFKESIQNMLSRRFNVPNCTAHFNTSGSLVYY
ncbi:MAG: PLAT/LH2 domain-containing protein [Saprospiraceae bacterium]